LVEEPVRFTDHALWQAARRGIDTDAVLDAVRRPEQKVLR
jgi:hypothetical protein